MAEPTENSLTTETVIQQGQVLAGPLIRDLRLRGLIERGEDLELTSSTISK